MAYVDAPADLPRPALTRRVRWLAGVTLLLGAVSFIGTGWRDYEATLEDARGTQSEILRLAAEHTRAVLETDSIVLDRMEDLVGRFGLEHLAADPDHARQGLLRIKAGAARVQSLWVLDRDGYAVASSLADIPRLNYRDREYFKVAQAAAPGAADYVSPLIVGRVSGKALFSVTRRLEDASGEFLGVLQVNDSVDDLTRFYAGVSANPQDTFAIFKRDGSVVFHYPLPSADRRTDQAKAAIVQRTSGGDSGYYIATSVFDGIPRLFAYRHVPGADLILTAGQPMEAILAPWQRRTLLSGLGAMLGMTVIGVLAAAAVRAARSAEAAQDAMMAALRARSAFFAAASHDLRQPYQSLRLFWTLADQRARAGSDPMLQTAVARMGDAMVAGEELLAALLDVAVLEAGRVVPRPQKVALRDILEAEATSFKALAQSRGLRLRWVDTSAAVTTDPVLLRRILRNLLVNALKFTERGGVLMGCRRRGATVVLEVWDTGKGIPADQCEAVFDDLVQLDNPSRTRSEGLGLGLAIVRRTANVLGCTVSLQSRPGKGTVFRVVLSG